MFISLGKSMKSQSTVILIILAISGVFYFVKRSHKGGGRGVPFPTEDCLYSQKTRNCKCTEFDDRKIFCTKFACPSGYAAEPYCKCEANCWNKKGINEQVMCSQQCMKNNNF